MEVPNLCVMLLLLHAQAGIAGAESIISPYIKHFEVLSYDTEDLHRRHVRARRATQPEDDTLQLNLTAFQRTFHLILRRDASVFSEGFTVESGNGSASVDLSHLYSGSLKGEPGSVCYGSVLEGQFEGTIRTGNRTYHIESAHRYTSSPTDRRSIIYREDAVVLPQRMPSSDGFCAAGRLNLLSQSLRPVEEKTVSRPRRTIDKSKTSCLLHLHVDHLYYKKFKSVEAVVAQIASYLRAVNDVFDKAEFDGINLINFRVKNLNVMFQEDESDPLNPLYIGPEKLLSLFSENNWGNYCLSYLLTNRDYSGVLGLAWEGKAGNWGGICSQYTTLRNGRMSTLNTGLITIQNYGQILPPHLVALTVAHELGHSLGSPHDEGVNCGDLGSNEGKGRYLMFPHATDEVRENSDKFSPCSIERISSILKQKKDDCFEVSNQPICGNHLVEEGEECDVGQNVTDLCCYSAKEPVGVQCRLKPQKVCSPSQGLCCSLGCQFKPDTHLCDEETDCQEASFCSGRTALCPPPTAKEKFTVCSQGTRICLNGTILRRVSAPPPQHCLHIFKTNRCPSWAELRVHRIKVTATNSTCVACWTPTGPSPD